MPQMTKKRVKKEKRGGERFFLVIKMQFLEKRIR
jgi:hypothetical protein